MSTYRDVVLPGGLHAEVPDEFTSLETDLGTLRLHRNQMAARTIEYWKNKPVFCALRDIIADEIQELENVVWDVRASKFIDRAFGESLDIIGRFVGEARNGSDDATYRVRLKVRERINRSEGKSTDILAIFTLLGLSATITATPPASFLVTVATTPTPAQEAEIPALVAQARAAGVNGQVSMPAAGTTGFRWGDPWNSEQWCDRSNA